MRSNGYSGGWWLNFLVLTCEIIMIFIKEERRVVIIEYTDVCENWARILCCMLPSIFDCIVHLLYYIDYNINKTNDLSKCYCIV